MRHKPRVRRDEWLADRRREGVPTRKLRMWLLHVPRYPLPGVLGGRPRMPRILAATYKPGRSEIPRVVR